MSGQVRLFGDVDGIPVHEVTLQNGAGARADIIGWGAAVRDLQVPAPEGGLQRVVLGLETLEHYRQHSPYFGAIAGRYANRIGNGRFELDGRVLRSRPQPGGQAHAARRRARARQAGLAAGRSRGRDHATFTVVTADGDQGFPGTLTATCIYRLLEPGTLRVELSATTNAPTVVQPRPPLLFQPRRLAGHAGPRDRDPGRFNHSGRRGPDPDRRDRPVEGTPFDLRRLRPFGTPAAKAASRSTTTTTSS